MRGSLKHKFRVRAWQLLPYRVQGQDIKRQYVIMSYPRYNVALVGVTQMMNIERNMNQFRLFTALNMSFTYNYHKVIRLKLVYERI